MPGIVVQIQPATVVMTGIEFMEYGNYYLDASEHLAKRVRNVWFDPLPYQLLCQSLELHLKSFIWLTERLTRQAIKNKYGHDLERLWRHAKARKIDRYCRPTEAREKTLALLGPYYKERKFAYLDLSMAWEGIPRIRAYPEARVVLTRLCRQLRKSLRRPILNAS